MAWIWRQQRPKSAMFSASLLFFEVSIGAPSSGNNIAQWLIQTIFQRHVYPFSEAGLEVFDIKHETNEKALYNILYNIVFLTKNLLWQITTSRQKNLICSCNRKSYVFIVRQSTCVPVFITQAKLS